VKKEKSQASISTILLLLVLYLSSMNQSTKTAHDSSYAGIVRSRERNRRKKPMRIGGTIQLGEVKNRVVSQPGLVFFKNLFLFLDKFFFKNLVISSFFFFESVLKQTLTNKMRYTLS